MGRNLQRFKTVFAGIVCLAGAGACNLGGEASSDSSPVTSARVCTALTGTAWVPSVANTGASNHTAATVTKTVVASVNGPLVGLAEPAPTSKEVQVTFNVPDLGDFGSISLVAEALNLPSNVSGAYPILVSLHDGTNELINIARDTGSCGTLGFFSCPSGNCTTNTSCSISWPSAYNDRTHWQQHQIATFGYTSVNTLPSCNRAEDVSPTTSSSDRPRCAFNSDFFYPSTTDAHKRLRPGTYTARYVMLAEFINLSAFNYRADLSVSVVKKSDSAAGGAVDLNVVLVGAKNVQASRTSAGKRNLDTLFEYVQTYYSQTNVGVSIGSINAIEWGCEEGGDAYANVNVNDLGTMFSRTSALVSSATESKAVNLFMVSTIPDGTASGLTILGLSGGIGGAPLNGSQGSGLAFSSLNKLDTYNPSCTTDPCPATQQQPAFADMGSTIAHEVGHFLGLNHPTESGGGSHDVVYDTPKCTVTQTINGTAYITIDSCLSASNSAFVQTNGGVTTSGKCSDACATEIGSTYSKSATPARFCPAAKECQFNHVMWWTSKNFSAATGTGDGNIFSADSGMIINYNPYIQ